MKIEIRLEIGIPMCNCVAEKQGSDRLLGSQATERNADAERNFSRKCNVFYVATVNINVSVSVFTCVLEKQLISRQRQLGKTAVIKVGAYIVSIDRKTTVYGLEAGEISKMHTSCP